MDSWARSAGEEPDVGDLRVKPLFNDPNVAGGAVLAGSGSSALGGDHDGQIDSGRDRFQGQGQEADEQGDDEAQGEGWYATPDNVHGVWNLCIRHRVRARKKRGEIMWLLQGGAGDEVDAKLAEKGEKVDLALEKEADAIMEGILRTV